MSNKYLLFSISPVQEFISASRKTLDLFSGSLLLHHLTAKAIGIIMDAGGEMIIPNITDTKELEITSSDTASIPNRFYSKIKVNSTSDDAVQAVIKEFIDISIEVEKTFSLGRDTVWNKFWDEQIKNFWEINWIIIDEDDENTAYKKAEQFIGKRKLLRNFKQLKQDGIKCSLILNHSAIHPSTVVSDKEIKQFWKVISSNRQKYFQSNERLSSIAVTKRLFLSTIDKNDSFPSTSTIAVSNFNRSLMAQAEIDTDLKKSIGEYAQKVHLMQMNLFGVTGKIEMKNLAYFDSYKTDEINKNYLSIDGDWLFEESYNEEKLKKEYNLIRIPERVKEAKNSRNNLFKKISDHNKNSDNENHKYIKHPSKYYAIFYFDGDNMGKHLGDAESDSNRKEISNKLRQFSKETFKRIVEEEHLGKIIYAGGDDALAFCALDDAPDIINEINTAFNLEMGNNFTASVGLVIAHHQTNLQQVLEAGRNALHNSKENLQRDSFSFSLLKRSGDHLVTGYKWHFDGNNVIEILKKFRNYIADKKLSTSFVYDLNKELPMLAGKISNGEMVKAEMKRLLLRRTKPKNKEEMLEFFSNKLFPLFMDNFETTDFSRIRNFISLLETAQFIARGGNE